MLEAVALAVMSLSTVGSGDISFGLPRPVSFSEELSLEGVFSNGLVEQRSEEALTISGLEDSEAMECHRLANSLTLRECVSFFPSGGSGGDPSLPSPLTIPAAAADSLLSTRSIVLNGRDNDDLSVRKVGLSFCCLAAAVATDDLSVSSCSSQDSLSRSLELSRNFSGRRVMRPRCCGSDTVLSWSADRPNLVKDERLVRRWPGRLATSCSWSSRRDRSNTDCDFLSACEKNEGLLLLLMVDVVDVT